MKIPTIHGMIDRRILVNYRVDPDTAAKLLPRPFRPKLYRGSAMVGICLIRLSRLRPGFFPRWMGMSSENAAHRFAVEWDEAGHVRHGVYVPRRDTSSRLNSIIGGRLFPGIQFHAQFQVYETETHFEIHLNSDDKATQVSVVCNLASTMPATSLFKTLAEASTFYEAGSVGYSATADSQTFQGIELKCHRWQVEPLSISCVHSSYFDDRTQFPVGTIEFDSALLMRGIDHEWRGIDDFCGKSATHLAKWRNKSSSLIDGTPDN